MERPGIAFRKVRKPWNLPAFGCPCCLCPLSLDTAWAIFASSTLRQAVQTAVYSGVMMSASQVPQGSCLTAAVLSKHYLR